MNDDQRIGGAVPRAGEPFFNAPWPVVALVTMLAGLHLARVMLRLPPDPFAFTAEDLAAHRWLGLLTYQFVHVGWLHLLFNVAATLAFGAPVARLMGEGVPGWRDASAFLLFFVVCGVVAALGFIPVAGSSNWALVGCSGAASGLVGATTRIMQGRGRLGALFGGTVMRMTVGWIIINAVFGLTGLTPGAGGGPVAWQAHIIGYFAGLLLIGVFIRLAGRPDGDHALAP
ncbi:MAG TPA: rhomboid family intramembrane serine protease [Caulobacteraceae bacterium]